MSEDRPQYQAERTVPTRAEIAERLRDVCAQMLVLSIDMQYVGGFGETAKKGDALALLARHLFVWVNEIEGRRDEQAHERAVEVPTMGLADRV